MITKTELLEYQADAVEKLRRLRIGALYMEMGTGKTRTALELVKLRINSGRINHVLWLCPCSVKKNLLIDIQKHSDLAEVPGVLTICGIETISGSLRTCEAIMQTLSESVTMIIIDESAMVKNHLALRSIRITQMAQACKYRMILNGTPITKTAADLFSQWYLLDPRVLGYNSYYSFAANHLEFDEKDPKRVVRALNTEYLAQKIEPYTYQCLKDEVVKLPDKRQDTTYFYLSDEQERMYDDCIERLLTDLDEMSSESIYQLFGALQSVTSGFTIEISMEGRKQPKVHRKSFDSTANNPRIKKFIELADSIKGEKVLVFCTYTAEIEALVKLMNERKDGCAVPFYGEIKQALRQGSIEQFRSSAQFMIANKTCGAYGLNLQFCSNIIFYSNDWNWGTRAQAEDRVHRIGQEKTVEIIDIVADRTIDESILKCLRKKENLSDRFKSEIDRNKHDVLDFVRGGKNKRGKDLYEQECV